MYKVPPLKERFWQRVNKNGLNGCWLWMAARSYVTGYGYIVDKTKTLRAHRVSWAMVHGPIPKGMCVCHRCDNRLCVRPSHLYLGTIQDNNRDTMRKGRFHRGEKHWNAHLTRSKVAIIRYLLATTSFSHSQIAIVFGVGPSAIHAIATGRTWKAW